MKKTRRNGFTLAELLIVVAIIGVLVAISIPIFSSQLEKSRQATDKANARSAYAAATTDWITDEKSESTTYTYNGSDAVEGSVAVAPYGKSSTDSSSWENMPFEISGVPLNSYVTVTIDKDGKVKLRWGAGGVNFDLSTAAGRRSADIDMMNSIESALKNAFKNNEIKFYKNFNQISVYSDGDGKVKDYRVFIDDWGYSTPDQIKAEKQKLIDIVESTGISIDDWQVYSTDEKWKYGYTININKEGEVSVYANSKGSSSSDGGYWYKPNYVTEDDRKD